MSARWLGRLLGSVLMLAALVGGAFAVEAGQVHSSGYEWGAGSLSTYDDAGDEDSGYEWG